MFAMQHRLNTRQRNSVLKLKVATNCDDWDTRMRILQACSEEVIADHAHGGGRPHWAILEDLGVRIGLKRRELTEARPLPSTQLAWNAWEGLMANKHWLEGIVANTCAERINVPGYGSGDSESAAGSAWSAAAGGGSSSSTTRRSISSSCIPRPTSSTPTPAGGRWRNSRRKLHMEDAAVAACERNLYVWEHYLNGIAPPATPTAEKHSPQSFGCLSFGGTVQK